MTFLACEVGIVTTYLIRLLWRLNNLGSLPSVVASQKLFLAPWMEASSPLNHPILEFVTLCGNWKATGMSPTLLCSPSCPQSLAQCQGWHWCSLNCWKDGWMDECIGGWKDEWRERWMNGWNDWTDGWMMNEWINEWMDEWMNERINEHFGDFEFPGVEQKHFYRYQSCWPTPHTSLI